MITDLPPVQAPRGWDGRLLARLDEADSLPPIRTRRSRRWLFGGGAAVALAAAGVLFIIRPWAGAPTGRSTEPGLAVEVLAGSTPRRGNDAAVGDTLVFRATLPSQGGELRVYRSGAELVLRCPGAAGCRVQAHGSQAGLIGEVTVGARGSYRGVLLTGGNLPPPKGTIDGDLEAAIRAGARVVTAPPIDVR